MGGKPYPASRRVAEETADRQKDLKGAAPRSTVSTQSKAG